MARNDSAEALAIAEAADVHRVTAPHHVTTTHRVTTLPVLVLNLHSSCNCRCVMCDIWKTSEARALEPAELEGHLASIVGLGVRWVVFTGGEPLLNRAFPELAAMLRRENVRVTLLTTGLLLGKYAEQVAESFDDIIVSIDGPERVHDAIRRVPGGFRVIGGGIQALRKRRADFHISARTTIQKANFRKLRETVRAAKDMGLDGISFLAVDLTSHAFNRGLVWPTDRQNEVGLSIIEVPELEKEIEALIDEHAEGIRSGFIAESVEKLRRIVRHFRAHLGMEEAQAPQCNAPWNSAVVEMDGKVRPCFFHEAFGDLRTQTLAQAINSEKALEFRAQLDVATNPICKRCVCSLNYRG